MIDLLPVIGLPSVIFDRDFVDKAFDIAAAGDSDPFGSVLRFYSVAISPVIFCVLDIIVKNKFVYGGNDIKVALPGEVVGLKNGD